MAFDYSSSFAGINNAINNIGRQNELAYQRRSLANLGQKAQSGDYSGAAADAFAAGDVNTGLGFLKLGQTAKENAAIQSGIAAWGSGAPAPSAPGSTAPVAGPASLIQNESGGNWQAQNNAVGAGGAVGHFGRLQFGQARIQDAINAGAIPAGTTPQAFMASPELQKRAEAWHFGDIDQKIRENGFDRLVGQRINGVPITIDGLRAVAHLGGTDGMRRFVQTGGQYNPQDRNGTRLSDYFARHGGGGALVAQPSAPLPVAVAENEADVQRLEAQMPGYGGAQPTQVAQTPIPGDDPVKLRADAAYYQQSNPEAARQMLARADALEQSRGVQVAQAPAADVPAPGAAPAQGFAVPGGNVADSVANDPQVKLWRERLSSPLAVRSDAARAIAQRNLDIATKDAERRLAVNAPTDVQRNYEAARRQGYQGTLFEYQQELRKAGATNIDQRQEGEYGKTIGKALGERMDAISKEGDAARADSLMIGQLRQLGGQIKNLGSGAALQGWLAERGIKVGPNVSEIEAYNALVDKLTPQQRVPGTGASSDLDVKMFKSALPNLIRTPGGNAIILDTLEAVAQDKAARAAIADRALTGELKPQDAIKELRALPDPMAAFKEARKSEFKNVPEPKAQTANPPMQGARQAPDGNWYVPDASRPGKYLQVQ